MDEFIVIKSKEDINDLFLYLKRHTKNAVKYDYDGYHKIYINKKDIKHTFERFVDYLIRNYAYCFINDYLNNDMTLFEPVVVSINHYKNGIIHDNIQKDMEEFASFSNEINLKGYLLFAFRKYEDIIMDAIDDAIELYYTEEEYKRILALISEYIQDDYSETDTIHIIKKPDGFYGYYDAESKDLTCIYKEMVKNELTEDSTQDDELLSVLINLKPENIFLHLNNIEMNLNFIYTLEAIFGRRFKICTNGCDICKS